MFLIVSVRLSALVERFGVSHMWEFFLLSVLSSDKVVKLVGVGSAINGTNSSSLYNIRHS